MKIEQVEAAQRMFNMIEDNFTRVQAQKYFYSESRYINVDAEFSRARLILNEKLGCKNSQINIMRINKNDCIFLYNHKEIYRDNATKWSDWVLDTDVVFQKCIQEFQDVFLTYKFEKLVESL